MQTCNAQEAALHNSVNKDVTETAVPASSLLTKQMLIWSQQLAQAAQSSSPSNHMHDDQAQDKHVSSAAGHQRVGSQSKQSQHSEKLHQEGLSTSAGSTDPSALRLSALGLTGLADNKRRSAAQPTQHTAGQGDPFAFDMGAFGMGHDMDAAACSRPAESAADRAEGAAHSPQTTPAPIADPYAFDMGAFGMASASEEANDRHSSSQSVSARAQPRTEGASAEACAGPADPFAFDMGAFGMSVATTNESHDSSLQLASPQPQHAAPLARDEQEVRSTAQADPFAFDMGSFGMGGIANSAQEASENKEGEGADTSISSLEHSRSDGPSTTALTMPEASGGSPGSDREATQSALSSEQHQSAWRDAERAESVAASRHTVRQEVKSSGETAGADSSMQSEQPQCLQHSESAAGLSMSFAPPEEEVFELLSEDEIRQLESLLLRASGAMESKEGEGRTAGLA